MATPIRWMKVQRKMPSNPDIKKWYPALAPITTVGLDDIIQGIVEKCTLTAVDMKACLQDLQDVVIEQIQRGNAVDFDASVPACPRTSTTRLRAFTAPEAAMSPTPSTTPTAPP